MSLFKKGVKGGLFILSAPSGAGKTTVVEELAKKYPKDIARVITCTTRKPRGQEINGEDYRFFSKEEFRQKIEKGEFLEYQEIFGHLYGTLKEDVDREINSGKHAFLIIDVQGAQELRKKTRSTSIFIMPPTFHELERRVRSRNEDDERAIEMRLSKAKEEMEQVKNYEYVVTNDNLNEAVLIIWAIIVATEHKQEK